jgi:hypothetical protein
MPKNKISATTEKEIKKKKIDAEVHKPDCVNTNQI